MVFDEGDVRMTTSNSGGIADAEVGSGAGALEATAEVEDVDPALDM